MDNDKNMGERRSWQSSRRRYDSISDDTDSDSSRSHKRTRKTYDSDSISSSSSSYISRRRSRSRSVLSSISQSSSGILSSADDSLSDSETSITSEERRDRRKSSSRESYDRSRRTSQKVTPSPEEVRHRSHSAPLAGLHPVPIPAEAVENFPSPVLEPEPSVAHPTDEALDASRKGLAQNLRTTHAVLMQYGLLNADGLPFPISSENLAQYIDIQSERMGRGEIQLSSLKWYLHSMRRMHIENGWEWDGVRKTSLVVAAWETAKKLSHQGKRIRAMQGAPPRKRGKKGSLNDVNAPPLKPEPVRLSAPSASLDIPGSSGTPTERARKLAQLGTLVARDEITTVPAAGSTVKTKGRSKDALSRLAEEERPIDVGQPVPHKHTPTTSGGSSLLSDGDDVAGSGSDVTSEDGDHTTRTGPAGTDPSPRSKHIGLPSDSVTMPRGVKLWNRRDGSAKDAAPGSAYPPRAPSASPGRRSKGTMQSLTDRPVLSHRASSKGDGERPAVAGRYMPDHMEFSSRHGSFDYAHRTGFEEDDGKGARRGGFPYPSILLGKRSSSSFDQSIPGICNDELDAIIREARSSLDTWSRESGTTSRSRTRSGAESRSGSARPWLPRAQGYSPYPYYSQPDVSPSNDVGASDTGESHRRPTSSSDARPTPYSHPNHYDPAAWRNPYPYSHPYAPPHHPYPQEHRPPLHSEISAGSNSTGVTSQDSVVFPQGEVDTRRPHDPVRRYSMRSDSPHSPSSTRRRSSFGWPPQDGNAHPYYPYPHYGHGYLPPPPPPGWPSYPPPTASGHYPGPHPPWPSDYDGRGHVEERDGGHGHDETMLNRAPSVRSAPRPSPDKQAQRYAQPQKTGSEPKDILLLPPAIIPKKRGRPSKKDLAERERNQALGVVPAAVKRKPGRPRKHPPVEFHEGGGEGVGMD
ncbi:uncharacterized protein EV422DRAFT_409515 [Fimicolochytrium jonesii]|uniref:uncharacterized protein n=1 Tax=Fimicolochytrium jonesii TaxID=1396493 RepID=UPI0022FE822E|nr:uncharacterized protein EV422DRAFT_409515 [Fimicolochytrium jonesii]KAI8822673.1 hypothetical protein EV422DRAFT_409515 [Fimicolochytrium jonesii]